MPQLVDNIVPVEVQVEFMLYVLFPEQLTVSRLLFFRAQLLLSGNNPVLQETPFFHNPHHSALWHSYSLRVGPPRYLGEKKSAY